MIHSVKNKANVSILKSSFCFRLFFLLSLLSIGNMHAYIKLPHYWQLSQEWIGANCENKWYFILSWRKTFVSIVIRGLVNVSALVQQMLKSVTIFFSSQESGDGPSVRIQHLKMMTQLFSSQSTRCTTTLLFFWAANCGMKLWIYENHIIIWTAGWEVMKVDHRSYRRNFCSCNCKLRL